MQKTWSAIRMRCGQRRLRSVSAAKVWLAASPCVDGPTRRWYKRFMQQEMKEKCLQRLARIEGQVRGIARMVGEDRYCIDILTQIAAAQAALRKVESEILQNHVNTCVEHAIASGNAEEQRRKVAELMEVLNRSLG